MSKEVIRSSKAKSTSRAEDKTKALTYNDNTLYFDPEKGWISKNNSDKDAYEKIHEKRNEHKKKSKNDKKNDEKKRSKSKRREKEKNDNNNDNNNNNNNNDINFSNNNNILPEFLRLKPKIKMTAIYQFNENDENGVNEPLTEPPTQKYETKVYGDNLKLPELPACECDNCKLKRNKIKNPYYEDFNTVKAYEEEKNQLPVVTHKTPIETVEECMCPTCQERRKGISRHRHRHYYDDDYCSTCDESDCSTCYSSDSSCCSRGCCCSHCNNTSAKSTKNKKNTTKKIEKKEETNNVVSKKPNYPISLVINVK